MELISRKEAKDLGLKRYFTGKPCKHGHVSERRVCDGKCSTCMQIKQAKWYKDNAARCAEINKKRYDNNKEHILRRQREYTEKNKAWIYKRNANYRNKNKEVCLTSYRNWCIKNIDRSREIRRDWNKRNPEHVFIRSSLHRIDTNWKGGRAKAESTLGYTYEQLKQHIESQFVEGMSWENRSDWHIDHIKPISVFLKEGIKDPAIINALSNLQPLWAKENLSKGAKWSK